MSRRSPHLERQPRPSQWLAWSADGGVRVRTGKVEIGQGLHDALARIVADELDLDPSQVRVAAASTVSGPDEGVTSGSLSIQEAGAALRWVAAAVREAAREPAAERFGVPADALHFEAARWCSADGRKASVAELLPAAWYHRPLDDVPPRGMGQRRRWVGQALPRPRVIELAEGQARFIHDLRWPEQLEGRVLHPPRLGDRLGAVELAAVRAMPGVRSVWRDGDLLGVLADDGVAADAASRRLASIASYLAGLAPPMAEPSLRVVDERGAAAGGRTVQASTGPIGAPTWTGTEVPTSTPTATSCASASATMHPARATALRTLRAVYTKPWIAHASLAPSCALACWSGDRLQVWTHSQGIFNLRRDLALAFGLAVESVEVQHVEGAGCYGHNGADDVAFDAAWLARQAGGQPVRVVWSRADEMTRAPLGPAMRVELEADLDADGRVCAWRHDVHSPGHSSRPGRSATPALLGSWQTAEPQARPAAIDVAAAQGGGAERNAVPGYALPAWRVRAHRVDEGRRRSSALRALGALANVFAAESFVDELARHTGRDPLRWRLDHLAHDPRARAVLQAVADDGGWPPPRGAEGFGTGLAWARYKGTGAWCAVRAEVHAGATLHVRRLVVAADLGTVVDPDGAVNQLEGGAIQATSWALLETVGFDDDRVTSDRWSAYPVLRFSQVPTVLVHLIPSSEPSVGAGEASLGPTAAAIANALHDALGVRVRDLPLTPERIVSAMPG